MDADLTRATECVEMAKQAAAFQAAKCAKVKENFEGVTKYVQKGFGV